MMIGVGNDNRRVLMQMVVASILAVVVAGCGFQLRGQLVLPERLQTLRIEASDRTTPFMQALVGQLRANGVAVVDANASNASVLYIERERLRRQALTISQDAQVREYVLHLDVDYSLEGPSGEVVVDTQSLRLSREYQFDAQAILGGRREEEFLGEDLSRAMAAQLMRQLSAEAQGAP